MRTTININKDVLKKLKDASSFLNISIDDIIALLMGLVVSKNILKACVFQGIKYQGKDFKKNWRKLHVRFKPQVYEQGLDLRKCFKLSVSFIISFAIINYLDELIEKLTDPKNESKVMDNYPLNYIFIAKTFSDIQGFIILWGIPEEKYLKNLIS